jgi:hypothetical protein
LLNKYRRFENSLIHIDDGGQRAYIESYRIHIALIEAFLHIRNTQDDMLNLKRLNRIYEQISEIAEMRFRGYDLVANCLERSLWL